MTTLKTLALTVLVVMSPLFYSNYVVAATPANEQIKGALEKASKARKLLQSNSVIFFSPTGETVLISDNPRWVVKGKLYDMWQNKEVNSVEQLSEVEKTIPLSKMKVGNRNVFDLNIHEGKDKTLTVFLDPFEKSSANVLSVLNRYVTDYQIRIIFTAVNPNHAQGLIDFYCATKSKSSTEILAMITGQKTNYSGNSCDNQDAINSYSFSQFLGIKQSPTLIASNDIFYAGMPKSLMTWLNENME